MRFPRVTLLAVVMCAGLGWSPVAGASMPAAVAPAGPALDRSSVRSMVTAVSRQLGIDPRLVDAVVRVESDYDPRAVSRKGAMGLMQLMPGTASRLKVSDPFDPEENVRAGVGELARLLRRYSGNLDLALAAYNAGEGAVQRYRGVPPYRETRSYVTRIMTLFTGKPYRLAGRKRAAPAVRLVRDSGTGQAVITNVSPGGGSGIRIGSATSDRPVLLRGGFPSAGR